MECIQNDLEIQTKPATIGRGKQKEQVGIKGNSHILLQEIKNSLNENVFAILPV